MKKFTSLVLFSTCLCLGTGLSEMGPRGLSQTVSANTATPAPNKLNGEVKLTVKGDTLNIHYKRSTGQLNYQMTHAVWSDVGGQDDLKWHVIKGDNTSIDLSQHKGYGKFHVHTYINIDGKMHNLRVQQFELAPPAASVSFAKTAGPTGQITYQRNKDQKKANILHAVWSDKEGQNDLVWYKAGDRQTTVDFKRHKHFGKYHLHTYLSEGGKMTMLHKTTFQLDEPKIQVTASVPQKGQLKIHLTNVSDLYHSISVPTWSEHKGQDDLVWYPATKNADGSWQVLVDLGRHQFDTGRYHIHTYTKSVFTDQAKMVHATSTMISPEQVPSPEELVPDITYEQINTHQGHYQLVVKTQPGAPALKTATAEVWSLGNRANLKTYQLAQTSQDTFATKIDIKGHQGLADIYQNKLTLTYTNGQVVHYDLDPIDLSDAQLPLTLTHNFNKQGHLEVNVKDYLGPGQLSYQLWADQAPGQVQTLTLNKNQQGYSHTLDKSQLRHSGRYQIKLLETLHGQVFERATSHFTYTVAAAVNPRTIFNVPVKASGYLLLAPPAQFGAIHVNAGAYPTIREYPRWQCTWYVYHRAKELGVNYALDMGNGNQWMNKPGYTVTNTPTEHSVVSYYAGQDYADPTYGHLAFVERVLPDGAVLVSETNIGGRQAVTFRTYSPEEAKKLTYVIGKK